MMREHEELAEDAEAEMRCIEETCSLHLSCTEKLDRLHKNVVAVTVATNDRGVKEEQHLDTAIELLREMKELRSPCRGIDGMCKRSLWKGKGGKGKEPKGWRRSWGWLRWWRSKG